MNTKSSLAEELRDKAYRDAFVASQLRIGLPMQCRALRENREWSQPQLAQAAGMSQPRISEMERPGERKPNLETLLRLASAFDVALQVRFVRFSDFVDADDAIDFESYYVESFGEDIARLEALEEKLKSVTVMRSRPSPSAIAKEFESPPQGERTSLPLDDASQKVRYSNDQQAIPTGGLGNFSEYLSDLAS